MVHVQIREFSKIVTFQFTMLNYQRANMFLRGFFLIKHEIDVSTSTNQPTIKRLVIFGR